MSSILYSMKIKINLSVQISWAYKIKTENKIE